MEHLDKNECVYKLSRSVKTSRGVGKLALTPKRLLLLTEGTPGYVDISTFRNIEVGTQPPRHSCAHAASVSQSSSPRRDSELTSRRVRPDSFHIYKRHVSSWETGQAVKLSPPW